MIGDKREGAEGRGWGSGHTQKEDVKLPAQIFLFEGPRALQCETVPISQRGSFFPAGAF